MARSPRAALLALALTAALALNTTANAQAPPGSLWYDGDFNGVDALANERNTLVSQAAVYDDFNVTAPLGWHVTAVFSDNLITSDTVITAADWEIRTGISEGNAGTLVTGGTTGSPVVTLTGRSGFGYTEYMVEVTGLNVFLPMLPSGQHYWLNVTPVGNGTGRSHNSTTSGFNCVGTPCGNDDNAFFNSTTFGYYFTNTGNLGFPYDFSDGVIGTVVPEPATVALLTCGLGALLIIARRRAKGHRVKDWRNKIKTKMNFTRICWAISACVLCLSSSAPESRSQTTEQLMYTGYGFEPVVNCDRRVGSGDMDKRIQFVWTDGSGIYRRISHDLGATWGDRASFISSGWVDPFAACDIWSTDITIPRIMYFGWFGPGELGYEVYFARSLSGTAVDSGPEQAEGGIADRPWLALNSASLYLSFGGGNNAPNHGWVKRAPVPTGTPPIPPVMWPPDDQAHVVFSSHSGTALVSNFPIAAHLDSGGTDRAFMMALEHVATTPPTCVGNNMVRIQRSLDLGIPGETKKPLRSGARTATFSSAIFPCSLTISRAIRIFPPRRFTLSTCGTKLPHV